jgi:hypothetical protein
MLKIIFAITVFLIISCNAGENIPESQNDVVHEPADSVDEDMNETPDSRYEEEIIEQENEAQETLDDDTAELGEHPEEPVDIDFVDDTEPEEVSDVTGEVQNFEFFLEGNNDCYMMQTYFPKAVLEEMLPKDLALPKDVDMKLYYPETELKEDFHPFIASFCHGSDIHDVLTKQSVPEQEELMFLFPVVYTHDEETKYMCSYSPVLYLDSRLGVAGGLYYGLRKEYRSDMEYGKPSQTSKWWRIEDVLEASFKQNGEETSDLPQFFKQILSSPFVTVSYPQPIAKMVFYQSKVYPEIVKKADGLFRWNYEGAEISHENDVLSAYSKYFFTMSKPMNANEFFDD